MNQDVLNNTPEKEATAISLFNLQFYPLYDKMTKALPSKDESALLGGDRRI